MDKKKQKGNPAAEKDKGFEKSIEEMGERVGEKIEKTIEAKIEGPARRFGYLVSIIVNLIMLWVVHQLTSWDFAILDFIKPEFDKYLWAVDLSLAASIIGNALLLLWDVKLFKAFVQGGMNFFTIILLSVMFIYFPFDFRELINVSWINSLARFAHILMILAVVAGTFAEFFKAISSSVKCEEGEE